MPGLMTTVPISMGETSAYAAKLASWTESYNSRPDAEKRLEEMLGCMSLILLRKRGDDKNLACFGDPRNQNWNVLHFQLQSGAWLCFQLGSDPGDLATVLKFEVCGSDGSEAGAVKAVLHCNMTLREMWDRVGPLI